MLDPSLDTWTPVADMSECCNSCGVGVLDGIIYAIGGENLFGCLKSIEAYTMSSGVWTTIADMHFPREYPGVVVLHVFGGHGGPLISSINLNSFETYNPKTNTWSLKTLSRDINLVYSAVFFNRPPHFKTYDD